MDPLFCNSETFLELLLHSLALCFVLTCSTFVVHSNTVFTSIPVRLIICLFL